MAELPSGTVTFLFTDIEGSTRLLSEFGAQRYAEILGDHRRICREAWDAHGGVEVDTAGDAFFVAFERAPDAVAAAAQAQASMVAGPIRVRMGLHTGTPLVVDGGYVGVDVHRAARIMAAGHGGQVLVSASTAALVEVELFDLGEHRLKDLSRPQRLYQLGNAEFPGLKTLYRTNLPVPATTFLGRRQELAEVVALLESDDVRLVTLAGTGGTGKTRLALQAAAEVSERFRDGITWVPLASLADPALVLPTVAEALEIKEEPNSSTVELVARQLAGEPVLLLLDNAEHLLPGVARVVAGLVAACPASLLLVTSRERLHVAGEHVYVVPSLVPGEAVELFCVRARDIGGQVAVGDAGVVDLCERLDGLPLALELAAGRTPLFTPAQLLGRLAQRLDLLKGGRDADPRQQTLRATIEWSHGLLADAEQQLFARLAVFAGGCTFEAAEEVAGADPDSLQSLLDKNLLRRRDGEDHESRYWLLETLREYAAEQLHKSGSSDDARGRHARWFLELAESTQATMREQPSSVAAALDRLTAELPNFRLGLEWFRWQDDAESELRLLAALYKLWMRRRHALEAEQLFADALGRADRVAPVLRMRTYETAGNVAFIRGQAELARQCCQLWINNADMLGDEKESAKARMALGSIALNEGDFELTASVCEEQLGVAERLGDARFILVATSLLGYASIGLGRYEPAIELSLRALALAENDQPEVEHANIGLACIRLGRIEDAREHYVRALELAYASRERGLSYALDGIAAITLREGHRGAALRLSAFAEQLRQDVNLPADLLESQLAQQTVETARSSLPRAEAEQAIAAGRNMTVDDAVTLAHACLGLHAENAES